MWKEEDVVMVMQGEGEEENGSGERTRVFVEGSKKRQVVSGLGIFVLGA